jgi:antitoxin (DNA-binding transcriptional repressor) of toxin-antitoxin stability system
MRVTAQELKAHLDEHLAAVEGGEAVTIVDPAGKPIAEIVPMRRAEKPNIKFVRVPPPGTRLGDWKPIPFDPPIKVDVLLSGILVQTPRVYQ